MSGRRALAVGVVLDRAHALVTCALSATPSARIETAFWAKPSPKLNSARYWHVTCEVYACKVACAAPGRIIVLGLAPLVGESRSQTDQKVVRRAQSASAWHKLPSPTRCLLEMRSKVARTNIELHRTVTTAPGSWQASTTLSCPSRMAVRQLARVPLCTRRLSRAVFLVLLQDLHQILRGETAMGFHGLLKTSTVVATRCVQFLVA